MSQVPSLGRLVELTVFAPIGVALAAKERLPTYVAEGRAAVERRMQVARFLGQLVVAQGRREVERRLAPTTPEDVAAVEPEPAVDPPSPAAAVPTGPPPRADELPIDDYESLAAGQVVARLRTLDTGSLDLVERFERSHRKRRTVLNRIAQLRSST